MDERVTGEYNIFTERQDTPTQENWRATVYRGGDGTPLIDRDGDTEAEAIIICVAEMEGDVRDTMRGLLPPDLYGEIKAALEGDSNDAENDALVAVADYFGIEYTSFEDREMEEDDDA